MLDKQQADDLIITLQGIELHLKALVKVQALNFARDEAKRFDADGNPEFLNNRVDEFVNMVYKKT